MFDRIPFTSQSIGNKLSVYNKIEKAKEFKQYLIPFSKLTDDQIFYDMIKRYKKVIIKPLTRHQGGGLVFIENYESNLYKINDSGLVSSINEKQLLTLIFS